MKITHSPILLCLLIVPSLYGQHTLKKSWIYLLTDSLISQRDTAQARRFLEATQRELGAAQQTDQLAFLWLLAAKAYYCTSQRNYPKAIESYKMVCDMYPAIAPHDTLGRIQILFDYSQSLQNNSQAQRAFPVVEQALAISTAYRGERNEWTVKAYRTLSALYYRQNNVPLAIEYCLKAHRLWQKADYESGSILYHLGMYYSELSDYETARTYYQHALEIFNKIQHARGMGQCLNDLGGISAYLNNTETAIKYQMDALKVYKKQEDVFHYHLRYTYKMIARTYLNAFKKYPDSIHLAVSYLQKAQTINEVDVEDALSIFLIYHRAYTLIGDHTHALAYVDSIYKGIKLLEAKEGEHLLNKQSLQWSTLLAHATSLGHLARQQKNLNFLVEAVLLVERAEKTLDSIMQFYAADKEGIYEDILQHAQQAIAIYNDLYAWTHDVTWLYKAFEWSEKSKALLLYQELEANKDRRQQVVPSKLVEKERTLQQRLYVLQKHLVDSKETMNSANNADGVREEIFQLVLQQATVKQEIIALYPQYFRDTLSLPDTRFTTIQRTLSSEQGILEYFTTDTSITAFLLRSDTLLMQQIRQSTLIGEQIRQLQQAISHDIVYAEKADEVVNQYKQTAYSLYKSLVQPFENALPKRLTIVPHGMLALLPFEALLTKLPEAQNNYRFHQYDYWGDQCALSYAPSATILQQITKYTNTSDPSLKPMLAMAPFYDGTTTWRDSLRQLQRYEITPLPYSGEEVYRITDIWQGEVLTENLATKEAFKTRTSQYKILHLATHAKSNAQATKYAYLSFAPTAGMPNSERLYAFELGNIPLQAEMVTLSACETGIGKLLNGEGVVSLARSFMMSGAKSVVQTHWLINDASTCRLMVLFYTNLKRGLPKDVALQQAKKHYRQNTKGPASYPYHWAGFVLSGDTKPLISEKK